MYDWIEKKRLAMGQAPFFQNDINRLLDDGFDVIINLQFEEYQPEIVLEELHYYHLPISDFSVPDNSTIERFFGVMNRHYPDDQIYIHCTAGCGRSGTMVGLWLAKTRDWSSFEELLNFLRGRRSCALETPAQENMVADFLATKY